MQRDALLAQLLQPRGVEDVELWKHGFVENVEEGEEEGEVEGEEAGVEDAGAAAAGHCGEFGGGGLRFVDTLRDGIWGADDGDGDGERGFL